MSIQKITTNAAGTQIKKTISPGERLQPSIVAHEERFVTLETEMNLEHTEGLHAIASESASGLLAAEDFSVFLRRKAPEKRQTILSGKINNTTGLPEYVQASQSDNLETEMFEKFTFDSAPGGVVTGTRGVMDGTFNGGTALNAFAKVGAASIFMNSSDDRVDIDYTSVGIPANIELNSSWTFSIWFNTTGFSGADQFVTIGNTADHLTFGLNDNRPSASIRSTSFGGTGVRDRCNMTGADVTNNLPGYMLSGDRIANDTWFLMTYVYDVGAQRHSIYMNDVLAFSKGMGANRGATTNNNHSFWTIGGSTYDLLRTSLSTTEVVMHGYLDNLRIWKRALIASEVAEIYTVDQSNIAFTSFATAYIRGSENEPLVVTFADGYDEFGSKDIIRALKSDMALNLGTLNDSEIAYIYLDADATGGITAGWTTQYPLHSYTLSGPTNHDIFNIPQMKMRTWDGTAITRLYIGEVELDSGGFIASLNGVRPYALRGETLLSTGDKTSAGTGVEQTWPIYHNIGHLFEQLTIEATYRNVNGFMCQASFQHNDHHGNGYVQWLEVKNDISRAIKFEVHNADAWLCDVISPHHYSSGAYDLYIKRSW